jgi:DNA-binding Lrp family transcriptional regulator
VTRAFVFINAAIGSESAVLEALKKVRGVKEAYLVYGTYDIVGKIETDTMDSLKELVTRHIRRIDAVRTTLTMPVVE